MDNTFSREQVRRVDQLAVSRYGIPSVILMENAGRNAAAIIRESYGQTGGAFVCCGVGNNGGDGCVIARDLHNAGWTVRVMVAGNEARMTDDTRTNFDIIRAMELNVQVIDDRNAQLALIESIRREEIIVDALLGTGFHGEVRSPTNELIAALNGLDHRAVIAIDVPSGLDCDTGVPSNATIRADLTITFVASKRGFLQPSASPYIGRVEVADIGAPRELIEEIAAEHC